MVIYRPIKEEKGSPNARTTEATYTSRRTTDGYIDSEARPKPAHCL